MEATQKKSGGKISYILQAIGLIPLLAFGILMLFFTSQWFTKIMYREVESELCNAAKSATTLLNAAYPGDYRLEGDVAYLLYKGDKDITREYALFDQFKEDTGLDITLFYQDTRILTTLYNSNNERIVGSGAPDVVVKDVLNTGESHFYTHTLINGKTYFSYYTPVRNADDTVIGMLFIGESSETVSQSIQRYIYPLTWLNHRLCDCRCALHLLLYERICRCADEHSRLSLRGGFRESEHDTGCFRDKTQ